MFKLNKIVGITGLLMGLTLSQAIYAQNNDPLADGVNICGVPVCEVKDTINALSELDENKRYNYINKLVYTYKEEADLAVLKNLLKAAKEIKILTQNLGDADWVVREASTLANNSIFNLAKYSPIKAQNMLSLFKKLDNATKRYEVIAYYQGKLESLENINDLNELVKFAEGAKEYSIAMGDEAWISRAAGNLASETTIKLTALDPAHEGVYNVKIVKNSGVFLDFDKIIILDSSSDENLVVNFINTKYKKIVFSYNHASIMGSEITGKRLSNGSVSSVFNLKVDRSTGAVKGTIKTTRSKDIVFKGTQGFSVRSVFAGQVPYALTENSVIGSMEGQILGLKGKLSIQSFLPNVYSATFVADNGMVVISFQGKFFPKRGVLSLTHKNKIKLVLALRNIGPQTSWRGVSFTTSNGNIIEAKFSPLD